MCGYPCYGCTMTTTEQQPRKTMADYVAQYGSSNVRPLTDVVDIDTRMTMALAGINAIIDHKHGDAVAEANREAEAAVEAAELLEPEPPQFKPHPILKAAGDVIRAKGWHQGDYRSEATGAVCALGAIIDAVYGGDSRISRDLTGSTWEDGAIRELLNRIAAETGDPHSVSSWNDSRSSVDEVVRLLY